MYLDEVRIQRESLDGSIIGSWCLTKPGAGSDAFGSMQTRARRDGDHFILNGSKTFITNAPYADVFIVYAKLDEAEGKEIQILHNFSQLQPPDLHSYDESLTVSILDDSKVVVFGASGVVGGAAADHFAGVADGGVIAVSRGHRGYVPPR